MLINKSYKVELKPNNKQKTHFIKSCGIQRFAYNWGLEQRQIHYNKTKKSLRYAKLSKQINSIKEKEFPWTGKVSKWCLQSGFKNLDRAFENFFRKCELKKQGLLKEKCGYPKFKTKKKGIGSYRIQNGKRVLYVFDTHVQLPYAGKVRLKQHGYIPLSTNTNVKILSATISEKGGKWFVSVNVEEPSPNIPIKLTQTTIGVDLGIKTLMTLSKGPPVENPKALKKNLRKLKALHRNVSRKVKGSKNRKEAVIKLAKLYTRIANTRKDNISKATTKLTKQHSTIILEDLNVEAMKQNHKIAQAVSDAAFGEIRRQFTYKGKWYDCEIIFADRFYPSSKLCNICGWKHPNLTLADRTWQCGGCGAVHVRDANASLNLEKYPEWLKLNKNPEDIAGVSV